MKTASPAPSMMSPLPLPLKLWANSRYSAYPSRRPCHWASASRYSFSAFLARCSSNTLDTSVGGPSVAPDTMAAISDQWQTKAEWLVGRFVRSFGRNILGHMARPDEHIVEHGRGQRAGEGIPLARVIGAQQTYPIRRHRFRPVTKRGPRPEAEFAGHDLLGEMTERDDAPHVSEQRAFAA